MSVRYGLQTLPVLKISSYPIWNNAKVSLGILDGSKRLFNRNVVTWDETRTTVVSAVLVVRGTVDSGWCDLRLLLNDLEIGFYGWGPLLEVYTARIDVFGYLANGTNSWELIFNKIPLVAAPSTLTFTATLEMEYTGDEPDEGPDWLQYLPYVAVAALAVLGLGVYSYRRK